MQKNISPQLTIAIATFNSEKTLPRVLKFLAKQSFDKYEILLIDGGSTDKTIVIGRQNKKARIANNPRTEPVYGKHLALLKAKGKYLMYLDHDEVLINPKSLQKKLDVFKENPEVKAVIGSNYVKPKGYSFISQYINEFGDPFSFFIYRLSKDARFLLNTLKRKYVIKKETKDYVVFDTSASTNLPIFEFIAGATVIDRKFFLANFPILKANYYAVAQLYYLLRSINPYIAVTKDDQLIHYSSDSLSNYRKKINWRIKNNIYNNEGLGLSGYKGRNTFNSGIARYKHYLFIPYSLLILPALIDALYLSINRREIKYLLHVYLCYYTAFNILIHFVKSRLGVSNILTSYDGSKVISKKI